MTKLTLTEFLSSKQKSMWLEYDQMEVYVRRSSRFIEANTIRTFDIANVLIPVESQRGKGTFKRFLIESKELLQDRSLRGDAQAIYIENVLNARLALSCRTWGLIELPSDYDAPSFYQWI